ncbi:hypothetical protein L3Q82_023179 [Scortum barcoo]|uniref:Uncharacterized protein n=1 Tax=Scortum barcoo TaxID=214431 RepID=A0ACB8WZ34_9TELE|nr:hypothetical protein L3Q82_023179 [Scortum barcoo]
MSDILCRWLNEELRLSKAVEPKNFAKTFSTGYLIGEVLHKYQLQNDFSMFMKKDTSISKLNNFTRLEPTLQLLGISFDINTAQDLMQEKQGVATRLLYQLYVSLEKKKKAEISGTVMEIMQPAANAGLHKKEHEIYSDRLHQVVKRDAELKLQKISQHYEEKCQQGNDGTFVMTPTQQKRQLKVQDEKRMKNIEKLRMRQKQNDIMTSNKATIVQVPKPPPYTSQLNLKKRQHQQQRRAQQAQTVQTEIAQFESNRKKLVTHGFSSLSGSQYFSGNFLLGGKGSDVPGSGTKIILQSNSKYIQDIRQRLEENAVAREQREKRRDRFLVEQLKAHEAQEEARRDEQLVKRLTRQTQQEQRVAAQLLQMRMQKEVIRENRLFREQQYQQRRERDFQEALEREAALAQQAKLETAEEIRKELEFCNRIAAERAQSRYKKHFTICKDILEQIVDLATKVGEYRLLTGNLIPEKPMREWKELLLSGLPLYEPTEGKRPGFEFSAPLDPVELKKQEILRNQDYDEYTNMVGEWAWPEEAGEARLPLTNNNILGHVVMRLRNIVHQPTVEPSSPSFPHFNLKACVLGKFCSGKTTCLTKIAKDHGIYVLSADTLIEEALNVYQNGEEVCQIHYDRSITEQQGEKDNEQFLTSSTLLEPDLDTQEERRDNNPRLSTHAMLGAAAEKELKKGNAIPNELLVDIIVEAIRQLPAQSGWILDGFPVDITQACLLETALGGSVDAGNDNVSSRANLAADPNPPDPPPPAASALDLALLLDISDECVVKRAYSQTDAASLSSHPTNKHMYLAQIPHRITAFQDTWPKLEKWFSGKQNILVRVDAEVDEEELYKSVESVLQKFMMQVREDPATLPTEDVVLDSGNAPDSSSATPPHVEQPPAPTEEAPDPTESFSSINEDKAQSVKSLTKSNTHSPRGHSRKTSTSSVTKEDSQGDHTSPPESASHCPGSSSWVYVDEPLPPEVPEYLCPHWDTMCDSYVNNIKTVMQQLRSQSTVINHHLYNIREEYKHYLGRPDLKQELVSEWQKDFNSIPDDMRKDEDSKEELHLRLDELCERLWDISDKRKEEDEQERAALSRSWLEEHIAILINHHSVLMQVELDRFKDTLYILKVYYLTMCKESKYSSANTYTQTISSSGIPLFPRHPDSSGGRVKMKNQDQTEPIKSPHEKLISDYEEALTAISKLVSAEAHQWEIKEQERLQEKARDRKVRNKIHKEYAAALDHEANSAKVRIALVKGHALKMMHSLQSRAEQTFSAMKKWMEELYLEEMKSIEQLLKVVRHHIEAGDKMQNKLVLESTDFYLNGDCHMVATSPPPPRPPPLERPTMSTPTVIQLESLLQQLRTVAPSGLMTCSEFSSLLWDLVSVNMCKNTLPEPWMHKNEIQLRETVSLLTDNYELIDWRRFLLSAALPWPFPSLTQLLVTLQRFKAADAGDTGYINEEQYLQVCQNTYTNPYTYAESSDSYSQIELWFPNESVHPVPEDPSEPLPYDRLTNLRRFFFQLFADHSVYPPRLDYVSMLQYFASDPNPRQGFIRALSVVLGQHLKHSSTGHLVKVNNFIFKVKDISLFSSMPSIEEAAELSSSDLDGEQREEETPCASSSFLGEQGVSIPALLAVICHKITRIKDNNPLPSDCLSQEEHTEHLVHIFRELGHEPEDRVPFSVLALHPFIQGLMETTRHYELVVSAWYSNNNMGIVFWTFSLLALPVLQSAKILTVCLIGNHMFQKHNDRKLFLEVLSLFSSPPGGSHYLLLDEISHNLHQHGHEVRMLFQLGNPVITGFSYAVRADSYQISTWSLGEKYIREYNDWFLEQQTQFLLGRDNFNTFLNFMGHLSHQCDKLLGDKEIITFLQRERYDITILDAFNPCSFILAHKLGVQYIAFYPGTLNGPLSIALPSPISYIPVFSSQLSDHMNLWGRAKNLCYSFLAPVGQELVWSTFREVAERHLESGSPPGGLEELHQGAELWAFNTDFSLEFPQPLQPYTVLVGGLLNKPAKPVEQDLESWISSFGEAGFIVVTLGSMVSSVAVEPLLVELVAGFSGIPQGVLWRYDPKRWPSHLDRPPNLKLVDWLPLNDLLGHKKVCLFITHGGQNSLLQAVYHAVPVLAIPLFGDQFDNVVRAERKGLGLTIKPTHMTRDLLSSTIQTLIQDIRFKSSALSLSRIHKSHPVPPTPRLIQWVDHILHSGGGSHLRPALLMQPWYQRYLLDVVLLLSLGPLGFVFLLTFCRNQNSREKHKKIE